MSQESISNRLSQAKVIGILRQIPTREALPIVETLVSAGMKAIEITMDGKDAIDIIKEIRLSFGSKVLLGAGTVMSSAQVHSAIGAGAELLFSPHLDETLVEEADRHNTVLVPGVMTPSEIVRATRAGATIVKVFPARVLGPSYIKDVLGPLSRVSLIPTGGVNASNAKEYIQAGATAVGMGGSLVSSRDADPKNQAALQNRVKAVLQSIDENKLPR